MQVHLDQIYTDTLTAYNGPKMSQLIYILNTFTMGENVMYLTTYVNYKKSYRLHEKGTFTEFLLILAAQNSMHRNGGDFVWLKFIVLYSLMLLINFSFFCILS